MNLASLIAGRSLEAGPELAIHNPYSGKWVGTVRQASQSHVEPAISAALEARAPMSRYARHEVLERARQALEAQREVFAQLITAESGLCLRETRYEVGRALDVLRFAAIEVLHDDGEMFAGDVSPQGKARRIFTLREPVSVVLAITPFNHPLNTVAHKVAPAIAAGAPLILKPSLKTPLTALRFAALLQEAGLPDGMLSVLVGPHDELAEPLVRDPRIELVTFTGSDRVGHRLAAIAGYKRLVLELGGNDPLIVFDDGDLDLAVQLAAEGAYRNSGQRCTAVKRILVQQPVAEAFTERLVVRTHEYRCGDPTDPATRVGTVIDETAAQYLETVLAEAVALGARIRVGGGRQGAMIEPTVIDRVPRDCRMVTDESFGPLAPVLTFADLDDALALANSTRYGLSSGVVTRSLDRALACIHGLKCGTVNINDIPGYRSECSPFGGVKDSGLGIKEGVREAIKSMTTVKTFSLPWGAQ
jgi:aldehyde dehydrogenase (NAD+)